VLAEHDNKLVLNEDKLAQLYDKIDEQLSRSSNLSKGTWSMCDDTALVATYKVMQKGDRELKIDISKEAKDEYTKSALWIDSGR
jgi:hypothetical protein